MGEWENGRGKGVVGERGEKKFFAASHATKLIFSPCACKHDVKIEFAHRVLSSLFFLFVMFAFILFSLDFFLVHTFLHEKSLSKYINDMVVIRFNEHMSGFILWNTLFVFCSVSISRLSFVCITIGKHSSRIFLWRKRISDTKISL